MEDKIKTQKIAKIGNKKYKGEVCIQLFNAKSGKLEKEVKGTNMVTNAIADIFASNYFGLLSYQNLLPIRDLFAGVLCFKNALTEDADSYYPPLSSNNEVIAHAGQTTYESASADVKRGIPNSVESGAVSNGYKFVWDFATTQGNGTISALSLTHKDTGDFWLYGGTNFEPIKNLDYPSGTKYVRYPLFWDETNRIAYAFGGSGTTLNLTEYKGYGSIVGIGINEENLQEIPDSNLVAVTHTITLPRNWNVMRYLFLESSREIHALYASGTSIERLIIDLTDFSTSRSDITVSGANFRPFEQMHDNHTASIGLDDDGYLYLQGNSANTKYKIQYSNPTNVTAVSAPNLAQSSGVPLIGVGHFGLCCVGNNGIIIDGDTAYSCAIADDNSTSDYLPKWRSPYRATKAPVFYMPCQRRYEETLNYPRLALFKMYMATIYNLENPVVKAATQTMKITYTITEVQENNE